MGIGTEQVAQRFINVVAGVPLNNPYPLFAEDEVIVIYGKALLTAILNVDYTVNIDTESYDQFTVTPTATLLAKINALIAADVTETNYITIRRELDNLTSATPQTIGDTNYLSREIERILMRFQGVAEKLKRSISLSPAFVGITQLLIGSATPGAVLKWSDDGTTLESGPPVSDIAGAQASATAAFNSAATATAQAALANTYRIAAAASAGEAAADAQQIAEILDGLVLGPAQPKQQIFTAGVANAASLVITTTPYPVSEDACSVMVYTTATGTNKGSVFPSDSYSYNDVTHTFSFAPNLPADTTKVEIKWFTALNVGTVSDKSVNWLTKIANGTASTLAGFDNLGNAVFRAIKNNLATPNVLDIPNTQAVKNAIDAAVAAITVPSPKGCSLYSTVAQAMTTVMTWDTEKWDDAGWHAANDTKIIPPAGARCLFLFSARWNFTANSAYYIRILKNGNILVEHSWSPNSTNFEGDSVSIIDEANGTDFYETQWFQTGTSKTGPNGMQFQAQQLN